MARKAKESRTMHPSGERHGYARAGKIRPEWQSWNHMIQRCYNPNDQDYLRYGGRGITVCQRWLISFDDFLEDMGNRPSPDLSLDRKDSDNNYVPRNCRWANARQQSQNRATVIWIEHNGIRDCVAGWVRRTGIKRQTILQRYHTGKSPREILTPVGAK